MNILKMYFKIVYSRKSTILMYLVIFCVIFGLFTTYIKQSNSIPFDYKGVQVNVALHDADQSEASRIVSSYLQEQANVKDVGDREEDRKDALFYNEVELVVTIPKGFEKQFLQGDKELLVIDQRPDSAYGAMLQQKINSYLHSVYTYHKTTSLSLSQASAQTIKDTASKSDVRLSGGERADMNVVVRGMYFNYMSYVMLAVILMVIGMTLHSVYRSEILKRNSVSPMTSTYMNGRLVLSNILFGILIWGILNIMVCILNTDILWTMSYLLMLINSFLFMLMCVCLAFMFAAVISNFHHVDDAMNGITNIVSLGFSFLGGAFVPQSLIPAGILNIAQFLPSYWYVKLNDQISMQITLPEGAWESALQTYGIMILFAISFLMIGLVIMKKRRSQDEYVDSNEEFG